MEARDVTRVAALEAASFSSPWHASTFHRFLERPEAEMWVVEGADGDVVAYAVLWCVLDQADLANLAVAPDRRGQGLGARLLDHLMEVARGRGVTAVFLEVRESNAPARHLYETRGFQELGIRRGYYASPREDALVLELKLGGSSPTL